MEPCVSPGGADGDVRRSAEPDAQIYFGLPLAVPQQAKIRHAEHAPLAVVAFRVLDAVERVDDELPAAQGVLGRGHVEADLTILPETDWILTCACLSRHHLLFLPTTKIDRQV